MDDRPGSLRRSLLAVVLPMGLALASLEAVELLRLPAPYPGAIILPAVMLSAMLGGFGSGLIAALLACVHIYTGPWLSSVDDAALLPGAHARAASFAVASVITGATVGLMKRRSDALASKVTSQAVEQERRSARHKLREAAREADQRYVLALRGSNIGMWDADPTGGGPAVMSPEFTRMLGYEENSPPEWRDIFPACIHDDDRDGVMRAVGLAIERGERYDVEFRVRVRSGQMRWLHCRGSRVPVPGGGWRLIGTAVDVTERRAEREALESALTRLRFHTDNASFAVVEWDSEFRVARWSPGAERLFGWTVAEVLGKHFGEWRFVHDDDVAKVRTFTEGMLRGEIDHGMLSNRNYHKSGAVRHSIWHASILRTPSGGLESVLSVAVDITDRERAEQALRESEERHELAMRGSGTGVWDLDLTRSEAYVSPEIRIILGYAPDDVSVGYEQGIAALHRDDRDYVLRAIADHAERDVPFDVEYRLIARNGGERWVHVVGQAIRDDAGKAVRMVGAMTDVTAKRHAEQQLREALQKLTYHVGNSPLAVIEWDRDFHVVRWSPGAERVFGWTADELIGKYFGEWRFVHDDDAAEVTTFTAAMIAGDNARGNRSNRNYHKDGRVLHCEWYNSILRDDAGRPVSVLSLVADVTEAKDAEARLMLLNRELQHRVKNNLAAVQVIAEHTLLHARTVEAFAPVFHGRIQALARMQDLLRSDEDYVPVAALVNRSVEAYLVGPAPQVVVQPGPNVLISARAASVIGMALHELATNAVKYGALSRPDGHVRIAWDAASTSSDAMTITWQESGGPVPEPPQRTGFGRTIIVGSVEYELGTGVMWEFLPEGVRWSALVPAAMLRRDAARAAHA